MSQKKIINPFRNTKTRYIKSYIAKSSSFMDNDKLESCTRLSSIAICAFKGFKICLKRK